MNVSHVDNVSEEISELSVHENQQQSDDPKQVEYIVYENEFHVETLSIIGTREKSKLQCPESFLHSVKVRCVKLKEVTFLNSSFDYHETPLRKLP